MKHILIIGSVPKRAREGFDEKEFKFHKLTGTPDPEAVLKGLGTEICGVMSCIPSKLTANMMGLMPNLKVICNYGVGVDNIDLDYAREQGIQVANTPDVITADTADLALGLLIALLRRIVEADMYVRCGKWLSGNFPLGHTLTGKTVGIVGLGQIGKAVAKRCEAFDMNIVYHGRHKQDVDYPYYADLKEMAGSVDVLMLTCPGGKETANLINRDILESMSSQAVLINVARGSVVDETALLEILHSNQIAGAGLDVFADEPHIPEAFFTMDHVVLSPHQGTATVEIRNKMADLVAQNMHSFFEKGEVVTRVK